MLLFDYIRHPELPDVFEFSLDDGTPALVRPLHPEDAPRLKRGFETLSALHRRRRFGLDADELPETLIEKLTRTDGTHSHAFGAADLSADEAPGIGIARWERMEEEPGAADVAIVVVDDYMNRGAGVLLHACVHLDAHRAGLDTLYYDVVSDNERFIRHLKALGAEFVGRAVNLTRLKCPVYGSALSVPHTKPNGRRFAQTIRRLAQVRESTRTLELADEHMVAP